MDLGDHFRVDLRITTRAAAGAGGGGNRFVADRPFVDPPLGGARFDLEPLMVGVDRGAWRPVLADLGRPPFGLVARLGTLRTLGRSPSRRAATLPRSGRPPAADVGPVVASTGPCAGASTRSATGATARTT
jgi:hypothetical protein